MNKIFALLVAFITLTFCAQAQVTIILEAHNVWGDNSGYQLLLDADHNTYGTIIPTVGSFNSGGDVPASVYAEFEYTVPVNADGSLTTTNIVCDGSATITIPAGTYDFCITNPVPGSRMWIASNGMDPTRADDFVFVDGNTYHFLMIMYGNNDACQLTITSNPVSPTIAPSPDAVDFGAVSLGNTINSTVTVNNYLLTSDVTATTAAPFEISADGVTFGTMATVPATGGTLNVRYTPTAVGTDNGIITLSSTGATDATVALTGSGVDCSNITIPYSYAFDNDTMFSCWQVIDANNDGYTFNYADGYAYYSYNTASAADDWLISPSFTFNGNQSVSFDYYAQTASYPERFQVFALGADTVALTEMVTVTNTVPQTQYLDFSTLTGAYSIGIHCISDLSRWRLYITNFNVTVLSVLDVTLFGPDELEAGKAGTFTAISSSADSYSWIVDGVADSSTTETLTYTFTTAGIHQVKVIASNSFGSSADSMDVDVYVCAPITQYPFTEGFENGLRCWTLASTDSLFDGGFGIINSAEYAYEGDYFFLFSSYNSASDQYLITPELMIPADSIYMFDFFYMGYSPDDNFKVLYSTTTNDISSFTMLADYQNIAGEWTETAVVLPAGTKYVAINYYGTQAYYLFVDNINIGPLAAPTVTISGPASAQTGIPARFVALSPLAETFAWTVDGSAVSTTTDTLTHTFTTDGSHTVGVTVTNSAGSATASHTVNVISCNAQNLPFFEGFESELSGCWRNIDNDGDGYFWENSMNFEIEGYEGNSSFMSASYDDDFGELTPDNWLITPALAISDAGAVLTWYVAAQDPAWASEFYEVRFSTTPDLNNFVSVFSETLTSDAWEQRTVNIDGGWAGQTVYIAFQHHNTVGMYMLKIDNVSVIANSLPPTVITLPVSNIEYYSATCGGNVTSDGGADITARGVCWSVSDTPTINDAHTSDSTGVGAFTSYIAGLAPNTTYHVRAYATNSVGTSYGEEVSFTTLFPCDPNIIQFSDTICENELPYIWNDLAYTISGGYTQTFTAANGCDSVVTLHLTVNPTQVSEFTVTTEDSCYIWNDQIYCTSGDYVQTLQTIHGCDSIVTLHLTITVGVDEYDLSTALMLYPNPTTGFLNVQFTAYNELLASMEVQVFDAYGKILQTTPMTSEATLLDLSHYADGIYFVKVVKDGCPFAVRKVVKS